MYLPKLVEFTKLKLLMVAVATSKRTELLMLKASARNKVGKAVWLRWYLPIPVSF